MINAFQAVKQRRIMRKEDSTKAALLTKSQDKLGNSSGRKKQFGEKKEREKKV